MMNRFAARQREYNQTTRDNWQRSTAHRKRVTRLLVENAPAEGGRLCVLGAGNLMDVDLKQAVAAYDSIDLVDLDEEALRYGVDRQGIEPSQANLLTPIDITGVLSEIEALAANKDDDQAIDRVIEAAGAWAPAWGGGYATVASTCLVSQLVDGVVSTLGEDHPRFGEVVLAVRDAHVRIMAGLLAPGGTGLLLTDVVSSTTTPGLTVWPETELEARLMQEVARGNFFTGVNPARLLTMLHESAAGLGVAPGSVRVGGVWRWDFGTRLYAVVGIAFRKHPLSEASNVR